MKTIIKGTKFDLDGTSIVVTDISVRAFLGHWYTYINYEHNADYDIKSDRMRLDDFLSQIEGYGITADQ